MDILFISADQSVEHLGIMTLSNILKKAGHNVELIESRYDKVKRRLRNNGFTILAYSALWSNIDYYLKLNLKLKEEFGSKVFSVFGGPQITCYPDEIINEPGVDGVCLGEGDYALLELANSLSANKPVIGISNWWIKQNGQIFRNPPGPLVKDLESLPFADRALFPNHKTVSIVTSRGCPYECSFCLERSEFRRRSVDNVIEELRQIRAKNPAIFIYFFDTTFNLDLNWLKKFSKEYQKEIGLPFYCCIRPDLATEECLQYLKSAGCFLVGMSIETANDYLRNEVLKKRISREQIITAAKLIKQYKIKLMTLNMIGIPFGSLEDDLDTLRFNILCRPDYTVTVLFSLYKNADIYNALFEDSSLKLNISAKRNYLFLDTCDQSSAAFKVRNLNKLFNLFVMFPFLLPFVPFLIRLPLSWFYLFINICLAGYQRYLCFPYKYLLGHKSIARWSSYLKRFQ